LRTGRGRDGSSGRFGAAVSAVPESAGAVGTSPFNGSSIGIEGDLERILGFFRSTPKKIQPFQTVPVIALAITESERYVFPFQRKPSGNAMTS
jgi:hypothetical protein